MATDLNGLKVAHFAAFGPGRSGQYATVRDLIRAERMFGVDAQFIDCAVCPKCLKNEGCEDKEDNDIVTQSMDWAANADIFVRHSVIPIELEGMGKPIILCLHGRPENSFLLEKYGQIPVYSFIREVANNDLYKAVVTFWKEHIFYFQHLIPEKPMAFVPSMVDMNEYKPVGKKRNYDTRRGNPNIMIADMWREDTTPFNILFAAVRFIEKYCQTGRIHMYGVPSNKKDPIYIIINQLSKRGLLGDVCTLMPNMGEQYRAADLLVTPHIIATRIIREALACGLPIIGGSGNPYALFSSNPRNTEMFADTIHIAWEEIKKNREKISADCRSKAEECFGMEDAGTSMVNVFHKIIDTAVAKEELANVEDNKITFAFSAYGDKFIDNVFVLLQSIDKVYDGKANVIFYYHNIDPEYIDEIKKILPYVVLKESKHGGCEAGDKEYKTAQKSLIWHEILEDNKDLQNVVLMDADMMVVRKMGKFFTTDFDVGFCYKERDDENISWPINCGIVLAKNSELVRSFLKEWSRLTIKTQKADKSAKKNGYILWGGGDQVSFGFILNTRDPNQFTKGMVVSGLKFQGFPMKFFNESRGIVPTTKTHIIHYKGESWQSLLRLGVYSKRRPKALCGVLYKLNNKVLEMWRERRHKILGKWSPDFEMKYWEGNKDEYYIEDIKRVYNQFNVDQVITDNMDLEIIETVVEIGGGAYGGALRFFPFKAEKYSIDILMDKFLEMDKLPYKINCLKGDFSNIPINTSSTNIVFAWEVLDHALTHNHFEAGVNEICRIMTPGGLLFFNHPLNDKPKNGHTVIKTEEEIIELFVSKGLFVVEKKVIENIMKNVPSKHKEMCVIFGKNDPKKRVPSNVANLISKLSDTDG